MADVVTVDEDGGLPLIGVNRPDAHNLWDLDVSKPCRGRTGADRSQLRRDQYGVTVTPSMETFMPCTLLSFVRRVPSIVNRSDQPWNRYG
jgi:hypothetical protein